MRTRLPAVLAVMRARLLAVRLALTVRLNQPERVARRAIVTANVLPLQRSGVHHGHLAESVLLRVQNSSDVGQALAAAELAVTLDVACHTVDDVGHGRAGVGVVGVLVHDRGRVDGTVCAERVQALVPVDVTTGKTMS